MNKLFSKKSLLWVVIAAIFNGIFFTVAGTEHVESVWISYGFIQLSFLVMIVLPFVTRKSSSEISLESAVSTISTSYVAVEFVIGLIFICTKPEGFKLALFIQLIVALVFMGLLINNIAANKQTTQAITKQKAEVRAIKINAIKVKSLIGAVSDRNADKAIERAYDAIYYSPVESVPAAADVELAVNDAINELANAVNSNNLEKINSVSKKIIDLMNQRNSIIKAMQ